MTKEQQRIYDKVRRSTPEYKAKRRDYDSTPEQRAKQKAYRAVPKHRAKQKAYSATPEQRAKQKVYLKNYYAMPGQRAKQKVYKKNYCRTSRGRAIQAAFMAKHKAIRFGAPGHFTGPQLLTLFSNYGNRCLRCRRKRSLTPDHVIPFSKGGTNYISNIQPLCFPCNMKKGRRTTDYR